MELLQNMDNILKSGLEQIEACDSIEKLQDIRRELTGKKSPLSEVSKSMGSLDAEQRKQVGMKISEIRELPTNELIEKVKDLKQEYFTIRFQQATGQNQDANRKRVIRKDIARTLTVVKERELAAK